MAEDKNTSEPGRGLTGRVGTSTAASLSALYQFLTVNRAFEIHGDILLLKIKVRTGKSNKLKLPPSIHIYGKLCFLLRLALLGFSKVRFPYCSVNYTKVYPRSPTRSEKTGIVLAGLNQAVVTSTANNMFTETTPRGSSISRFCYCTVKYALTPEARY